MARIPKKYQKEFENVEPKHAEDIAKPLDEKGCVCGIDVNRSDVASRGQGRFAAHPDNTTDASKQGRG